MEERIVAVTFRLVTSGAVAARIPFVAFEDGNGNVFAQSGVPFTVAESQTVLVTFGVGVQEFGANNSAHMGASIPDMRLYNGCELEGNAVAIAAGDQISAVTLFVEQFPIRE